eukprot:CAMPEP_0182534588 /NCGR_PEP_ID=MMETSP1323-20130603/16095_1 /TAXON_ID=236787 /ORGANISM="Florenciella parvula, Strain RCC1693" /LENGTH=51 /DNA_ID=CAMNT_0024744625 /DNA_START=66 /DNA_END=221 /DNA_ORIENTATION=-
MRLFANPGGPAALWLCRSLTLRSGSPAGCEPALVAAVLVPSFPSHREGMAW